jgi:glycopeptide antibiotics resistance protein
MIEFIIIFAIPWMIYRIIILSYKKQFSFKTEFIKAIFYFSIIFIYYLTIFPFPFFVYPHEMGNSFQHINLVPFSSIYGSLTHFYYMVPIRNIGGNILLFMPLGFAIPLRFKVDKLWKVMLIGFFTSLAVEVVQLFISIRSFDVDDLILNTVGTIMGLSVYQILIKVFNSSKHEDQIQLTRKF